MVDFMQLILDIKTHDYTNKEIGDLVGCSAPHICEISNGNAIDPRYALGDKIIKLHKRITEQAFNENMINIKSINGFQVL